MKHIEFQYIQVEGFRSIVKHARFKLNRTGLNLIKGVNGVGKTTLFDALVWCLYGINLKNTNNDKIPSWPEIRTKDCHGTQVSVYFNVDGEDYEIERNINYTAPNRSGKDGFAIYRSSKDGSADLITENLHKKDVQNYVDDLLGMDAQTFMSSILFGQRMAKLVESDNSDKRNLFEKLFESQFIKDGKEKANLMKTEKAKDLHDLEVDEAKLESELAALRENLQVVKRLLSEFESDKEIKIHNAQDDIDSLIGDKEAFTLDKEEYQKIVNEWNQESFNKKIEAYNKLEDKISEFNTIINGLDVSLAKLEGEVSRAETQHRDAIRDLEQEENKVTNWIEDRDKRLLNVKNRIDELHKKWDGELKAINKICPACGQDLPTKNVRYVEQSINERYGLQESKLKEEDIEIQTEKPPEIDIESFKKECTLAKKQVDKITSDLKTKQAEHDKQSGEREKVKKERDILGCELESQEKDFEKYQDAEEKLKTIDDSIREINSNLKVAESMLKESQKLEPPKVKDVGSLKGEIETKESELIVKRDHIAVLTKEIANIEWWIKTGFASSGLPAYVFRAMLDNLNRQVIKYADRLGVSVEFSVDFTKASKPFQTICSIGDRVNKDYKEFSGGQKQRLDIVLMFAMYDMVSYDTDINLLIMDESFEGLDEEGEAAVFDLIRTKAEEGKSIYIITHSPHIDSLYSSTIEITSENGRTQITG